MCEKKELHNKVNPRLADTSLSRTLALRTKSRSPAEAIGLTENDSRYYGLSLLRNYRHFLRYQPNIFTV